VLLDESAARALASQRGLRVSGTLGVLCDAAQAELFDSSCGLVFDSDSGLAIVLSQVMRHATASLCQAWAESSAPILPLHKDHLQLVCSEGNRGAAGHGTILAKWWSRVGRCPEGGVGEAGGSYRRVDD
jgi:hypothetical protein